MNGTTKRKSRYLTTIAAAQIAGPRLASKASTTNTGSSRICQPGTKPYHDHQPTRIDRLTRKVDQRDSTVGERHDQAREVDLADQVGVADHAARGVAEHRREQGPRQQAGEDHQRVGRPRFARQLGDVAEHDREDHHGQERPDEGPGDADDGLLVAHRDVAPGEDQRTARDSARDRASTAARPGPASRTTYGAIAGAFMSRRATHDALGTADRTVEPLQHARIAEADEDDEDDGHHDDGAEQLGQRHLHPSRDRSSRRTPGRCPPASSRADSCGS